MATEGSDLDPQTCAPIPLLDPNTAQTPGHLVMNLAVTSFGRAIDI